MASCSSSSTKGIVATVINHHTFTVNAKYTFPQQNILGVGSYGVVAAAYDTVTKRNIAIKRVRPFAEDEIYAKLSLRELRCLKLMGVHPNVGHNIIIQLFINKRFIFFILLR